jgi:ABC-type phosphate/phosphonate transport system substrate-binding protein
MPDIVRTAAANTGVIWAKSNKTDTEGMRSGESHLLFLWTFLAGFLVFQFVGLGSEKGDPPADNMAILRYGLSEGVIDADINGNDALAATTIFAQNLGRATGLWEKAEAQLFSDLHSLVAAVSRREVDIIALSTLEYLEIEQELRADACATYVRAGSYDVSYLILVRRDSGINSLADLQGKRIDLLAGKGTNSLASIWFNVLLSDNGFRSERRNMVQLKEVQKPPQAILAVFFKQTDAAVVAQSSFETAVALNPQIGKHLKVLTYSPRYVPTTVCISRMLPQERREQFIQTAINLHETTNGLQIFTIFKTERVVLWQPSFADNVRKLLQRYKSLGGA